MKFVAYVFALALLFAGSACTDRDKKGKLLDTSTSGTINIAVDESLKPLMEAEIDAFEAIYPTAHIEAQYISEPNAVDALLNDSVRLIVVTRKLYSDEEDHIKSLSITPTQFPIGKDGIALIVNKDNPDSLIQFEQIKAMLQGTLTDWNQINPKSKSSKLEIVFDDPKSGMIRFLNDSVIRVDKLPSNCFALHSNTAVVDYVAQKPNALGLIGVSWISDKDSIANSFLKTIRVASISKDSGYYKPYPAYLALNKYPLQRNIFMVSREARSGLASGFITFVASDRGQRIILKSGLVPVTMPLRIVEINNEPLY